MSITNTDFVKLIAGQVTPDMFSSSVSRRVARICLDYYQRFHEAPGDHFYDEFVRLCEDDAEEDKASYVKYVQRLRSFSAPNAPYVLRRVSDFVKKTKLQEAALEFAELVHAEDYETAENIMYTALKAGIHQQDIGLEYLSDTSSLSSRQDAPEYLMKTGMKALDKLIGGYQRGQFLVFLGGYKGMKTWCLMFLARAALMQGLNVLYISHEVTLPELELRWDMMLTGRGTQNIGETVKYLIHHNGKFTKKTKRVKSVFNNKIVRMARKRMRRFHGRLFAKKYPMGQCTFSEIIRYLHHLETYENFVPDVLINDYVDIMDLGKSSEIRHQLNEGYIWSKGLADERNILVATVSQVRRAALEREHLRLSDVAEDIRKVGNCDLMLAIGRTNKDKDKNSKDENEDVKTNMAKMFVLASRSGIQDVSCGFSCCPIIGQFCLSSWVGGALDDMDWEMFGDDEEGR